MSRRLRRPPPLATEAMMSDCVVSGSRVVQWAWISGGRVGGERVADAEVEEDAVCWGMGSGYG
jgi:hypothetical protein